MSVALTNIDSLEIHDARVASISINLPDARIDFAHIEAYVPTDDPNVLDGWTCTATLSFEGVHRVQFEGAWEPNVPHATDVTLAEGDLYVDGKEVNSVALLNGAEHVYLWIAAPGRVVTTLHIAARRAKLDLVPVRVFEQFHERD